MPPEAPCLQALPIELIQLIITQLPHQDLKNVALTARFLWEPSIEPLWRSVSLTDTWRDHGDMHTKGKRADDKWDAPVDDHDDTPIIVKLYLLAMNPILAQKVHVLEHKCHLPTPAISELPYVHFDSPLLSCSPYMRRLIRLAARNLTNVHTLRIVFGHLNITRALLEAFLDPRRPRCVPVRRLWLESCSLEGARINFGNLSNDLESIRIRRLRAECEHEPEDTDDTAFPQYRRARWGMPMKLHDGQGGFYWASMMWIHKEENVLAVMQAEKANEYEDACWSDQQDIVEYIDSEDQNSPQPISHSTAPPSPLFHMFKTASTTLTKLNLDWIMWRPVDHEHGDEAARSVLYELSRLRFPHLHAFQIRNAVTDMTRLPVDIYLLESTFLAFLEAHLQIRCLAFPLDRFYSHRRPSEDVLARSRKLVAHLGMILVDVRLDAPFTRDNDSLTDGGIGGDGPSQEEACIRRRRFISEFAPHMRKLEHIKLEGAIPRDERREILRALHFCPLKRIIIIGVTFPLGNTWGRHGQDLKLVDEGFAEQISSNLEEEDSDSINAVFTAPTQRPFPFTFSASYGWPLHSLPFLHTLATHHASSITSLKVCGFNGSPVLSSPLPITRALLHPLHAFHNLRQLIVSLWLVTFFEDDHRDAQILQSWRDTRSPASTALAVVSPPVASPPAANDASQHLADVTPTIAPYAQNPAARPQDFNRWEVALKTRFTPAALAYRVAAHIGPFLSEEAKRRRGGVKVRASFLLGEREERKEAHGIFDLDIRVGEKNEMLSFVGPREEGERGRWRAKMEGRRWF